MPQKNEYPDNSKGLIGKLLGRIHIKTHCSFGEDQSLIY